MADEGGWAWQMATLRKQFPGLPMNSGYRPGARTSTGGASYHGRGRAVDVPPRMDVFEWIRTNYPQSRELIYSPAGNRQILNGRPHVYTGITRAQHYDHVHWAIVEQTGPAVVTAGLSNLPGPVDEAANLATGLGSFIAWISDPGIWLRLGVAVGGAALLIFALLSLTKRSIDLTKVVSRGTR